MGVKVSDHGGGDFQILDPGTYPAVCTQIVGIGPQATPWGEKEKVKIRFETPSERTQWTDGDGVEREGPMVIWASYTCSLSEKANLRKDLESWRGREFSADELKEFDLDAILGKPCMISVAHRKGDNGRTYANITSISRLMKGIPVPQAEGDLVSFDFWSHTQEQFDALPEWLRKQIDDGKKLADLQESRVSDYNELNPPPTDGFEDTEILF